MQRRRLFRAWQTAKRFAYEQGSAILSYKPPEPEREPEPVTASTVPQRKPTRKRRAAPVPLTIRPRVLERIRSQSDLDEDGVTLGDARMLVVREIDVGCVCPACAQHARVYKRKLNAGMAASLCWLVRVAGPDRQWVQVNKSAPAWVVRCRELPKLVHWRLLEDRENEDDSSKRTSGWWRPTAEGVQFVREQLTVPRYIFLYGNALMGFSEDETGVREALADSFDYGELMSAPW